MWEVGKQSFKTLGNKRKIFSFINIKYLLYEVIHGVFKDVRPEVRLLVFKFQICIDFFLFKK